MQPPSTTSKSQDSSEIGKVKVFFDSDGDDLGFSVYDHVLADWLEQLKADEQLAGSLLRGQSLDGLNYCKALLPNVKVLHRDKTHAARRLCSRGWKADAYLHSVTGVKQHPLRLNIILLSLCCCCLLLLLLPLLLLLIPIVLVIPSCC